MRIACAAALLCLAACATRVDGPALSPQAAAQALAAAPPTKAGIAAALGPATPVHFDDSGFEAWVYRWPDGAELVLLFAPDGTLSRQRQRAAPAAR